MFRVGLRSSRTVFVARAQRVVRCSKFVNKRSFANKQSPKGFGQFRKKNDSFSNDKGGNKKSGSSGGSGGGSGGDIGPRIVSTVAALGLLGVWLSSRESSGTEINWQEFATVLLESGEVDRIVVSNNKIAEVFLRPGAVRQQSIGPFQSSSVKNNTSGLIVPDEDVTTEKTYWDNGSSTSSEKQEKNASSAYTRYPRMIGSAPSSLSGMQSSSSSPQYHFAIGSVEIFERKLEAAQRELGIEPRDFIPVQYVTETNWLAEAGKLLPTLLIIASWLYVMRSMGGSGGTGGSGSGGGMSSIFRIGRSNARKINKEDVNVTYSDVAGCDEAKKEIMEFVDFLKDPSRFTRLGAKIPKGALLCGPPGTGKTLLAKATAGEASVPFYSISGSEFVEMFVGVGASRIRSLFADAKKNAPCIIFIDEIDAIGRQRAGGGGFATNDEREQTLNQILTEMDGFSGNTGVIVIAATNRGDILDNALLRPGRFDRRVPVDLPDKQGRAEILKVHCRDKPLASDVDIDSIASRTIGFSGASLQNLMNEAAIVAARNGKDVITFDEIDYAIDRLTVGMQKQATSPGQSKESRLRRQTLVAYHEAGHAIMAALTPGYDNVAKVTIIPRSNGAGGFTLFTPSEDRMESGLYSLRYLKSQLAVALGGRVAEELAFGVEEVTTGASNDLQQVRNLARRMIAQWGFRATADANAILDAPVAWETPDAGQQMFGGPQTASGSTEQLIDAEVKALVSEAYATCKKTLKDNWALMEKLKEELIENETVDSGALQNLVLEHTQSGGTMATA